MLLATAFFACLLGKPRFGPFLSRSSGYYTKFRSFIEINVLVLVQLNIPVTVVMPVFAPMMKRSSCESNGATVILHGENIQDVYILKKVKPN